MAPPYNYGFTPNTLDKHAPPYRDHIETSTGLPDDIAAFFVNELRLLWRFAHHSFARVIGRSIPPAAMNAGTKTSRRDRPLLVIYAEPLLWQLRRNLAPRRIFSVPHLLVVFWFVLLLWGERWTFHAQISHCQWDNWEKWPSGATPHHLVFVADPQIIDAHSYPGRPWPLSSLTITITDNYMRRSYLELQEQLRPDSVFFLGDLFDGGREWKPDQGSFEEPPWSDRPENEKGYAKKWKKKYGQAYWLKEYFRFGDIFFDPWTRGGSDANPGQRGRKLVASLPGNHDLGFGSQIQTSVRNRFEAFFGDTNRVDVIGNHTIVSIDAVSLSAGSSDQASEYGVPEIFEPTHKFLENITWAKQKAVARELRYQRGAAGEVSYPHRIESLDEAKFDMDGLRQSLGGSSEAHSQPADLPTILLSHVPLYRPPGTPCGPKREHWPPTKPTDGSKGPVVPDDRNAIAISRGYQYQNAMSESDSIKLIKSVGNVVHAFSGDDHDYCKVVHDEKLGNVPEITVKSFSLAMGVPTPGFLMVSLYNPIDEMGRPLAQPSSKSAKASKGGNPTMQTHLCLQPNALSTFARYGGMVAVSLVLLAVRAALVPIMGLQSFALDPNERRPTNGASGSPPAPLLPVFKDKVEDDEYYVGGGGGSSGDGTRESGANGKDGSGSSGFFAFQSQASSYSRGRSQSTGRWGGDMSGGGNGAVMAKAYHPQQPTQHQNHQSSNKGHSGRTNHASKPLLPVDAFEMRSGPKIQIIGDSDEDGDSSNDDFLNDDYYGRSVVNNLASGGSGDRWQPAARRGVLGLSLTALTGLRRLLWSVLHLRGSGRSRRHHAGLGLMRSSSDRRRRPGPGSSQSPRQRLCIAGREFWTMAWRVTWMVVLYWAWLNHKG